MSADIATKVDRTPVRLPETLSSAYDRACQLIAPTWPLDRMIAVNPFWKLRHQPAASVAARLSALARCNSLMPPSYYADQQPQVTDRHLESAAAELGLSAQLDGLLAEADGTASPSHWHNISDFLDSERDRQHKMAWRDEITHQISQFCAASFQQEDAPTRLYERWLEATRADRGIPIIMGEPKLRGQFAALPEGREELLAEASAEFGVSSSTAELYAHALLLDINGWASWVAYLRWQAGLNGVSQDLTRDLLAIRFAWDLALWRHLAAVAPAGFRRLEFLWRRQLRIVHTLLEEHHDRQASARLWQRAAEFAYQEHLSRRLLGPVAPAASVEPVLQAVFCIDVRSEVYRRHLEAQAPGIQTLGFAGFFGLPIDYQPGGTACARPQLPGLLAPTYQVTDTASDEALAAMNREARWSEAAEAPPAMFSLVEATGPLYAFKLLQNSLRSGRAPAADATLRESKIFSLSRNGEPVDTEERAELAWNVLQAMGLKKDFAPVVLLVGHGSTCANNPHAASLACGACGGQSGEVNARVLAMLLNDRAVRDRLAARGALVPDSTVFIPALHDTTTDDLHCFGPEEVPPEVSCWLDSAGNAARRERAQRLGLKEQSDKKLAGVLRRRARDWSQVRPEWGLAGNAAFIAAPRSRTRGRDLEGRVFLHDYDWKDDPDFSVLELIMTAPMIVAHWINMQYNASTADNARYGSGNKVLHNVVNGNLGVFEGNGGDLRVGLPMQSLHDGRRWMHTTLRLSVYLEAPAVAIAAVYERHESVRQLVDNDWLFLFRMDEGLPAERLYHGRWRRLPELEASA